MTSPEPDAAVDVDPASESTPAPRPAHAHTLDRDDVDLAQLAAELTTRLGRPVAATTAELADGSRYLLLHDASTGEEVTDADGRTVAGAIRSHQPPPTAEQHRAERLAEAERKAEAGDTAGALADVLALLRQD